MNEHSLEIVDRAECLVGAARFMFSVVQLFDGEGMAYVSRERGSESVFYVCCKQPMGETAAGISIDRLHQSLHKQLYVADKAY